MLEVTLLKVEHAGRDNARALLPYIQGSDVCSMEAGHLPVDLAREYESGWEAKLSWTRSKFQRLIEQGSNKRNDSRSNEFSGAVYGYMHSSRVRLWNVERFEREESKHIDSLYKIFNLRYEEGCVTISTGEVAAGMMLLRSAFKAVNLADKLRDKNIAQNIECAEDEIRRTYPLLKKDPIKLSVILGAKHTPERYTSYPIRVIPLAESSGYNLLDEKITEAVETGDNKEIDVAILRCATRHLIDEGLVKLALPEIASMSFDDIKKELETLRT